MKIWLSKNSEVPIREQLVTQITIGVLGGDLAAGDKLPSTQEIARRYAIHANTASSAYRELADRNLVEFRKGSGFYVRGFEIELLDNELRIERLINDSLDHAENLGLSAIDFIKRLERRLSGRPHKKLTIVESDKGLRDILIAELEAATAFEIAGISFEEFERSPNGNSTIIAAMSTEKPKIDQLLISSSSCQYLNFRSVAESLTGQPRPAKNELIAIVSGWQTFLHLAKTILVAAGIDPETLVIHLLGRQEVKKNLDAASIIVCDYAASGRFAGDPRVQVFKLIADSSIVELNKLANDDPMFRAAAKKQS